MKLGEHLNSLLLNMCDDVTLSRMSLRTVLDICSKHIRNSSCDPPFSYIRKLVRLVLGSLSQVHSLLMQPNTAFIVFFHIFILTPSRESVTMLGSTQVKDYNLPCQVTVPCLNYTTDEAHVDRT